MKTERRHVSRVPSELPDEMISRVAEKSFEVSQLLAHESIGNLASDLLVERFMTRELTNARPDDTAGQIRSKMTERGFRHMLVCEPDADGAERLKGVISDRNLNRRDGELAKTFMSTRLKTIHAKTSMMQASAVMASCRISCLPVVDEHESDRVVGILTLTDVVLGLNCLLPVMEGIADQLAALERKEASSTENEHVTAAAQLVRELRS
ncbi:MAG: CBS domain-containing protein [Pirellulales bacterium]|nr:CBS domain-containing protein [Pirellulales bacterium]